jgi:hypothetical protein
LGLADGSQGAQSVSPVFLEKHHQDWDSYLSPSYLVDQMWHVHILDVVNYCHDMMLLCGHVVGHNPDGASDIEAKRARDLKTHEGLEEHLNGGMMKRYGT